MYEEVKGRKRECRGEGGGLAKMDLFRSEEMQLVRLIIPSEAAHDTIYALGEV